MRKQKHMYRTQQARPAGWFYFLSVGSLAHKTTHLDGISNYPLESGMQSAGKALKGHDTLGRCDRTHSHK